MIHHQTGDELEMMQNGVYRKETSV